MGASAEQIGRFLSYLLRHRPDSIGLELDVGGWARIDDLVRLTVAAPTPLTAEAIAHVVRTNDKQRYTISDDGTRIRANQGHSFAVELDLVAIPPPAVLFHGTATRFLAAIREQGLLPMGRQHVHLSAERRVAVDVGRRHGAVAVLVVDAAAMHAARLPFFRSANGVWLTAHVPPRFLGDDAEQ